MSSTVLIVDDAEFMRVMLREILVDAGLQVVGEAANGEEAVRLYNELRPDLITLDITMPVLDGVEALKRILALDPRATAVMVSALGQKQKVLEAIQSGARDFLIKPFDPDRVRATIDRLVEQAVG